MEKQEASRVRSIPGDPMCQNIVPLTDWVEEQLEKGEAECVPCDLSVIAPWYRDMLEEKGYPELAAKVQGLARDDVDVVEVASTLDEIKESVIGDKEIERELLQYDCMLQNFKKGG